MTQSSTFIVDFYQRLSVPETNDLRTRSVEIGFQSSDCSVVNTGTTESKRMGHQSHTLDDANPLQLAQSLHKPLNQTAVCQASLMAQTSRMVKSPHEISSQASLMAQTSLTVKSPHEINSQASHLAQTSLTVKSPHEINSQASHLASPSLKVAPP